MKGRPIASWAAFLLRLMLGGVFLWAGMVKIQNSQDFADSIETFKVVPPEALNLIALGVPPLEIIVGLMLIAGWAKRLGAFSAVVLLAIFCLLALQALIRGLPVDCGCFGSGEVSGTSSWVLLARDIALLIASAFVYIHTLFAEDRFKPFAE